MRQARSAVRCWASRLEGELHPIENRLWGGLSCGRGPINSSEHDYTISKCFVPKRMGTAVKGLVMETFEDLVVVVYF